PGGGGRGGGAGGGGGGGRGGGGAGAGRPPPPPTAPDFAALCDRTPARAGAKRVGVVIDFGTAADAPSGERPPAGRTACAQVPADASAGEALAAVAKPLRYDADALLCGIAGYPRSGCAEQVAGGGAESSAAPKAPSAAGKDAGGGPSAGLVGGIGAVVVLGAAGVWQARRRRG
ncbi:SCO2322 family protein, partial [Streptomyces sp. NPDC059152]|uniref:SCO2322 family protein n=1 Tax=Streptomyces sp. NPDC059152 TaxID=3346742 RepID=UPI00369F92B9